MSSVCELARNPSTTLLFPSRYQKLRPRNSADRNHAKRERGNKERERERTQRKQGGERERERARKGDSKIPSPSKTCIFIYFLLLTFKFIYLFFASILDGPDRLQFSRQVQGRPSPRFTCFPYLMFPHQILTRGTPLYIRRLYHVRLGHYL